LNERAFDVRFRDGESLLYSGVSDD
jgi:hypothetical protein